MGTLSVDYNVPIDSNDYSRLLNALAQAGWSDAETSAMHIETEDIVPILRPQSAGEGDGRAGQGDGAQHPGAAHRARTRASSGRESSTRN